MAKDNRSSYKILAIGEKATIALTRPFPDILYGSISQITAPINFPTAASVVH